MSARGSFKSDMARLSGVLRAALAVCVLWTVVDASIPVRTKTIVNVGGSGEYDEVVDMPCEGSSGRCMKRPKQVDGCLAPFDEEQTLKFRGPMEIEQVGVYYPGSGAWNRVSYYDRKGVQDNIVFMGNYGRAPDGRNVDEESCYYNPGEFAKFVANGDDYVCHGFNQTYCSSDGKCARRSPQHFSGVLEDNVEVNIMQGAKCKGMEQCGYHRGVGHHGWEGREGGSKMFAVRVKYVPGQLFNAPALWFLHASVVRTANNHFELCNCRGVGSPGGCGELDIAEVVTELNRKMDVETSIYSFKGAYSDQGAYRFERALHQSVVYITIFNKEGYIQVLEMDDFEFGDSVSAAKIAEWNGRRELVMKMPGPDLPNCPKAPKCTYSPEIGQRGFAARIQDGVRCNEPGGGHAHHFNKDVTGSPNAPDGVDQGFRPDTVAPPQHQPHQDPQPANQNTNPHFLGQQILQVVGANFGQVWNSPPLSLIKLHNPQNSTEGSFLNSQNVGLGRRMLLGGNKLSSL